MGKGKKSKAVRKAVRVAQQARKHAQVVKDLQAHPKKQVTMTRADYDKMVIATYLRQQQALRAAKKEKSTLTHVLKTLPPPPPPPPPPPGPTAAEVRRMMVQQRRRLRRSGLLWAMGSYLLGTVVSLGATLVVLANNNITLPT